MWHDRQVQAMREGNGDDLQIIEELLKTDIGKINGTFKLALIGKINGIFELALNSRDVCAIEPAYNIIRLAIKNDQEEVLARSYGVLCRIIMLALEQWTSWPKPELLVSNIIDRLQEAADKGWWQVLNGISYTLNLIILSGIPSDKRLKIATRLCGLIEKLIENGQSEPWQYHPVLISIVIYNVLKKGGSMLELVQPMLKLAYKLAEKGRWWEIGNVDEVFKLAIQSNDADVIKSVYEVINRAIKYGREKEVADSYGTLCYPIALALERTTSWSESELRASNIVDKLQEAADKGWWQVLNGISYTLNQTILSNELSGEQLQVVEKLCKLIGVLIENEQSDPLCYRLVPISTAICNVLKKGSSMLELAQPMLELAYKLAEKGWWWAIGGIEHVFKLAIQSKNSNAIECAYEVTALAIEAGQNAAFVNPQLVDYHQILCLPTRLALKQEISWPRSESLALSMIKLLHNAAQKGWRKLLISCSAVLPRAVTCQQPEIAEIACDLIEMLIDDGRDEIEVEVEVHLRRKICDIALKVLSKESTDTALSLKIAKLAQKMVNQGQLVAPINADKLINHAKSAHAYEVVETMLDTVTTAAESNQKLRLMPIAIIEKVNPQEWLIDDIINQRSKIMIATLKACNLSPIVLARLIGIMTTTNDKTSTARQALVNHKKELLLPILLHLSQWTSGDDVDKVLTQGLLSSETIHSLIKRYINNGTLPKESVLATKISQLQPQTAEAGNATTEDSEEEDNFVACCYRAGNV